MGAEDHLVAGAIQEVGHGGARFSDYLVAAAAGDERSAGIRVGSREVVRDSVDHRLRHLRTPRRIEEHRRLSVYGLTQGGKLLPHPVHVQLAEVKQPSLHPMT